jgi:hypothetical protein
VVGSMQVRPALACGPLYSGADSAVKTTVVGLVAHVTYLLVTTLDCGCKTKNICLTAYNFTPS